MCFKIAYRSLCPCDLKLLKDSGSIHDILTHPFLYIFIRTNLATRSAFLILKKKLPTLKIWYLNDTIRSIK